MSQTPRAGFREGYKDCTYRPFESPTSTHSHIDSSSFPGSITAALKAKKYRPYLQLHVKILRIRVKRRAQQKSANDLNVSS